MLETIWSRNPGSGKQSRRAAVSESIARWRRESGIDSPTAQDNDSSPVHPLQVVRALRKTIVPNDALICDSGFNQIWGGHYFEDRKTGRNYMGPRGFGVTGSSLPGDISHALAGPHQRVVALCGDGGFAMVIQELETALRIDAPITVCILNNSCLHFTRDTASALRVPLLFNSTFRRRLRSHRPSIRMRRNPGRAERRSGRRPLRGSLE